MRKILLLFLIIIISGCCQNQEEIIEEPLKPQGEYLSVPGWFVDFPAGDYALGVARSSIYDAGAKAAARQNAAVNYSRNHNCYIVNKRAIRSTELSEESGEADFRVVVSSEPQYLRSIYDQLKLLDYFWYYDNFIGIYSLETAQIDTLSQELWIPQGNDKYQPDWYEADIRVSSEEAITDVQAHSHDLISACQEAFDKGRVSLAGYKKIKVEATSWHIDGLRDRLISLETLLKMNKIEIRKIYIRCYFGSGGIGYQVFLRLSTEPVV